MKKLYHKIDYIDDGIIALSADHVGNLELARIHHGNGTKTLAITRCIKDRLVFLDPLEPIDRISTQDSVEFLGTSLKLSFAQDLMVGRIFNSQGEPIDAKPAIVGERVSLPSLPFNFMAETLPYKKFKTGIDSIDWLSPMREGESCTIMSRMGEPHHRLIASIAENADADLVVVGIMGLEPFDAHLLNQQLLRKRHRTIIFCHTTKDAPNSCVTLPDCALATAEQYALLGARVLVLLTDVSALARAHMHTKKRINALTHMHHSFDLRTFMAQYYEKAIALKDAGCISLMTIATGLDEQSHQPFTKALCELSDQVITLCNGLLDFGTPQPDRSFHPLSRTLRDLYQKAQTLQTRRELGAQLSEYEQRLMQFAYDYEELFLCVKNIYALSDFIACAQSLLTRHFLSQELSAGTDLWAAEKDAEPSPNSYAP